MLFSRPIEIPVIDEPKRVKLLQQKEHLLETGILNAVVKGDRDEVKALIGAKANIETTDQVIMFSTLSVSYTYKKWLNVR
jgi:hypothetical protein